MRACRRAILAVVVALPVLLVFGPGSAFATHVQCGDTITKDTKLDNDLLDCWPVWPVPESKSALVIGADDVTLDLNGHTISTDAPAHGIGTKGVNNGAGFDRLTIKNGTIAGYELSLVIGGVDNTVTNVAVQGRMGAVVGGSDAAITKSTVVGGFYNAIQLLGPGPFRIENNVVEGGLRPAITAYPPASHADISIRHNVVSDGATGIDLPIDSGAVVEHNFVTEAGYGIYATGGLLKHNRVERNGVGIRALGFTTVSHNTANYNRELGIEADATVIDGGGNKAKGNGNPLQCLNVFCK